MASWRTFETESPDLAARGSALWAGITRLHRGEAAIAGEHVFSIAYLATVRRDGAPRLHPVCPFLVDGQLRVAIPPASPKGHDLRREPRCVLHALPGPDDVELNVRARAHEVDDPDVRASAVATVGASGVGGMVETVAHHPLFRFDLERVDMAWWVDVGQPGTYAERRRWVASS